MGDLRVSVYVPEDVALDDHVHERVTAEDEPNGWLYLGKGHDVALWGSAAGLRRLAAGLVLLAERADGLGVLRYAAPCDGDGLRGESGVRAVSGS
jgi:hypothetical protein